MISAISGHVMGVRQSIASVPRNHAIAAAANATAIASSTVVTVSPNKEPGIGRSNGDTAASSITPAGTVQEPANADAVTRGM